MKKDKYVGKQIKSFTMLRKIGQGTWSDVYEAVNRIDKSKVALKMISQKLVQDKPKIDELIKTQIKVLKACNNQNVISYIDSFKTTRKIFIAIEYCNGGDLQQYLQKKRNLPEDQATNFLKQILNGFKGLHQVGSMHRDFKAANVLLNNGICKIADLGFAKIMKKKDVTRTYLGTTLTMAPQVLDQKPYGFQADIWSIGIVYYQMLYGKYPYQGINDYDMLRKIKKNDINFKKVNISAYAKDFIEKCLTIDPKKRINWVQIYQHPLLNKNQGQMIYTTLDSKIALKENKQYYMKQGPKKHDHFSAKQMEYQQGHQFRESANLEKLVEQMELKNSKKQQYLQYQKQYLDKRNNIMFVSKFITPIIPQFYHIKGNHSIALFILSKKAFVDMTDLKNDIENRKNIFNVKNFEDFSITSVYKNIYTQCSRDLQKTEKQCGQFSHNIDLCSNEIKDQFNIDRIRSHNFSKLVRQTIQQYWYMLAQHLPCMVGQQKQNLLKVLQALFYYKQTKMVEVLQFDQMMTIADYSQVQKGIMKKMLDSRI